MQIGALTAGKLELTLGDWIAALESAVEGVARRGKASPGDKTMLDSLLPALEALKTAASAGASFLEALRASETAAQAGMLATIPMIAKKGRASYLGERSIGTQDPGSTSSYLLLKAVTDTWSGLD
jgi:dihydroxyacetone kinase-like protein